MDKLSFCVNIDILVHNGNYFSPLCICNSTSSDNGSIDHLVVINSLDMNRTWGDKIDINITANTVTISSYIIKVAVMAGVCLIVRVDDSHISHIVILAIDGMRMYTTLYASGVGPSPKWKIIALVSWE